MEPREKWVLEEGGVRVDVEYRYSGSDEGLTFRVYGEVAGEKIELLRFDCFKNNPHYHYAPGKKNEVHDMEDKETPAAVKWVVTQLSNQLSAMIEHAGYAEIARSVDQKAIAAALAERKKEIERLKPAQ